MSSKPRTVGTLFYAKMNGIHTIRSVIGYSKVVVGRGKQNSGDIIEVTSELWNSSDGKGTLDDWRNKGVEGL